jgi:hypothetical protein
LQIIAGVRPARAGDSAANQYRKAIRTNEGLLQTVCAKGHLMMVRPVDVSSHSEKKR